MKYTNIAMACLLTATFAGAAHADDDAGFYLGGGIGQARLDDGEFEGDDTSFRVFGGYSFNRYIAVEAGYIDGGKMSEDLDGERVSIETKNAYATGIAKLPIGDYFVPFAKVGYTYVDSTVAVSLGTQRVTASTNDSEFIFGGGLEIKLGENFRLRAEYDKIDVSDAAFDFFSFNAAFKF